ncbi:MAG: lipocalin family protein [Alistipes sp.]|nr:lipocalin family protein [Candidatus Alistipes equi]
MKTIKYFFATLMLLCAMACGGGSDTPQIPINGDWQLKSMNNMPFVAGDVYITFNSNATFELYQKIGTSDFEHFSGTYQLSATKILGKYTDGTSWLCDYSYTIHNDTLTLTDDETSDNYVYESCEIPEDVISNETRLQNQSKPIL